MNNFFIRAEKDMDGYFCFLNMYTNTYMYIIIKDRAIFSKFLILFKVSFRKTTSE